MRVVGYLRESAGTPEGEPAFAQSERIRRWILDTGHQLVAVCQDIRSPGLPLGREGYRALLEIVSSGEADAVVVPDLTVFSPDKVNQEIMIWDLRRRGALVVSTDPNDVAALQDPSPDHLRLLLRDALGRLEEYAELVEGAGAHRVLPAHEVVITPERLPRETPRPAPARRIAAGDVIVELVPAEEPVKKPAR